VVEEAVVSEVRVRYAETDQMGVAHHSSYLPWLEIARTDFLRLRGMSYKELEGKGYRMPLLGLSVRYHSPARYDDLLAVEARLVAGSPVRFSFDYRVVRREDGCLLSEGRTDHVVTDLEGRPRRIPSELLSIIGGSGVQA
jgi:acyl-CoA thioester hydrolase